MTNPDEISMSVVHIDKVVSVLPGIRRRVLILTGFVTHLPAQSITYCVVYWYLRIDISFWVKKRISVNYIIFGPYNFHYFGL